MSEHIEYDSAGYPHKIKQYESDKPGHTSAPPAPEPLPEYPHVFDNWGNLRGKIPAPPAPAAPCPECGHPEHEYICSVPTPQGVLCFCGVKTKQPRPVGTRAAQETAGQSAKEWLLDQLGPDIAEAALEKTPWWIERMMDYADHVTASLRAEVAQLKALLNYDGQRYESWLEVGQALIDRKAEVARLKESLEILGGRADLEKMRADIAEEKVARLQENRDKAADMLLEIAAAIPNAESGPIPPQVKKLANVVARLEQSLATMTEFAKTQQQLAADLENTLVKENAALLEARSEVARLEKERDEWRAEEDITAGLLKAAEARIRELEGGK